MNKQPVKTLFITRHLPYPPMGGSALRSWQNINIMLKWGSVGVVSIQTEKVKEEENYPPGVALWKNYSLAEIDKERSILEKIQNKLWWLQPKSHPWANQLYSDRVVRELNEILTQFKPDLIVFKELWLYPYLNKIRNCQCNFIYDADNVEISLRQQLHRSVSGIKSKIKSSLLLTKIRAMEGTFVRQVDRVWVCSEDDADLMRQLYGQNLPIKVVPNGINISDYETVKLGNCPLPKNLQLLPYSIIFTAAFAYKPNATSAEILIDQIYPKLQKIYPDCRLLLVGRDPTKHMKQAAKNDSGIIVTGKVPDVRPYFAAASVVVVPLLEGGGTRLKILEAFAAGLPVVSTSKGAEGLKAQDGKIFLIRDSIEDIVAGIVQLWSDPSLGKRLADAAYELVREKYSWQAVSYSVNKAIEDLIK